ncbi:MAG TPA: 16S rRNA (adenine(1518)-N(6)/adenine(1519)-N(6))-dimethyltransferase RsmA [bacterium]|nr:16S rRNA (adenine(1518)-N(6)/adenine(1519)-N(6))-dimethyltransferase RsmA [bacterium]HOL67050.1 16S rRNA (adenine(1518)-N(6)/adenine(1519)-N(6))-dimethyltransferase RsmA [bacterium]HPP11338.1 16S rRNA (adenine(1518)-N(6)/adenine(1519)-N(6))-dimethyltransferase RsmA [bacterium]
MDFLTLTQVKAVLKQEGIDLKKSRGQNLLIDRQGRDKLLSFADLSRDDVVIEIGAGLGALTEVLLEKVARVYAFEVDARFCRLLRQRLGQRPGLVLLEQDFLKSDAAWWDTLPEKVKVISNTPYNLSTAIVCHLLPHFQRLSLILLTVQKEVGQRLVAGCGSKDYAPVSVLLSLYASARICYALKKTVFFPQPEVDSVVVKILPYAEPKLPGKDLQEFESFLSLSFRFRRKKLSNVLEKIFNVDKAVFEARLKQAGLPATVRMEQLSPEQTLFLFRLLGKPGEKSRVREDFLAREKISNRLTSP